MDFFGIKLEAIKKALECNDSTLFATAINEIADAFDSEKYGAKGRLWEMFVGYESTWSPQLYRTQYEDIRRNKWNDGHFSYENKRKVLKENEDILAALDRPVKWRQGYSYWDKYDCESKVEIRIFSMLSGENDELSVKVSIPTGTGCKMALYTALEIAVTTAANELKKIKKNRDAFDAGMYGFNKVVTDYNAWIAANVPAILANNGFDGKGSWYDGISIRPAECDFWTGHLNTCTPDGIIFWVGGDSTDDENKISYKEWNSKREYYWYSDHAEVRARLSESLRQEMSKKIFEYIKSLCRDGKLK